MAWPGAGVVNDDSYLSPLYVRWEFAGARDNERCLPPGDLIYMPRGTRFGEAACEGANVFINIVFDETPLEDVIAHLCAELPKLLGNRADNRGREDVLDVDTLRGSLQRAIDELDGVGGSRSPG